MAVDYDAIARKYGGVPMEPVVPTDGVDYDAIAKKYGGAPVAPFFTASEPKKEQAGFFSSLYEQATALGLADEAAAFTANPTEENRKAFIDAGNSKYESAGGFGMEGGLARNWRALKETAGGSLGSLLAPAAAGTAAFLTTGVGAIPAAAATMGTQYTIQNLLRQAQEQEKATVEGKTPEAVSLGKAALAATGQTALDYAGGKLFKPLFGKFPGLKNIFGEADEVVVKETGKLLEDAVANGTYKITKTGVLIGAGKGTAFEVPQEIFQQAAERWNAGLSLTDKDAQEEYKQAAIGATLLGAPMGGASAALRQSATKTAAEKKLADETALATKTEAVGNISAQGDITEQRGLFDEPAVVPVEEETEEEIFAQNDDDAPADIPPPAATTTPAATPAEYTPSYDSFKGIPGITHLFRTGRGSVYAQNDKNQTIRDRSGKDHRDATTGLQPSSGKTIYLTSGAINRLGSLLQDNRATQLVPTVDKSGNPIAQVVLMEDYGTGEKLQKAGSILAAAPYTLTPQVGLNPVEIYDSISPANQAAPGIHFGNKITEVLEVPQTPAATPATTATPVEAPPPVTTATPAAEPTPTPAVDENGQMQLGLVQAEPVTEGDKAKLATTEFEQKYRQLIAPDTQEVSPLPAIITKAMLDALDIPKEAPIRKRVINEDLNNPTIRAMLLKYANNEAVKAGDNDSSVRVKRALNIQRMGTNANQMELDLRRPEKPKDDTFDSAETAPTPTPVTPAKTAVTPTPVTPTPVTPAKTPVTPTPVTPATTATPTPVKPRSPRVKSVDEDYAAYEQALEAAKVEAEAQGKPVVGKKKKGKPVEEKNPLNPAKNAALDKINEANFDNDYIEDIDTGVGAGDIVEDLKSISENGFSANNNALTRRDFIKGFLAGAVTPNVFAQEADAVLLKILKTGDINAALSYIRDNSTEPTFRELATQLLTGGMGDYSVFMFADNQDLVKASKQGRLSAKSIAETHSGTLGFVPTEFKKKPTIFLRNSDEVTPTEETILHESIHAYITARYNGLSSYLSSNLRLTRITEGQATKSIREIQQLWRDVSDAILAKYPEGSTVSTTIINVARNADEFLAYSLTEKEVQAFLRRLVYDKDGKLVYTEPTVGAPTDAKVDSVWSRLLDWIMDLLYTTERGLERALGQKSKAETKNALNYLMDASQVMFKESRQDPPDMKFTKAITEYVASKPLTVKAVENIDAPLPKSVVTALNAGDLAGALKALGATGKNKSIGFMARALLRAVGGTKVEVVTGLVDGSGNPVAGLFDPITNTIKLDSKTGINSHAVLHEMTHAAVSAVLANPSHPVTRQLTVLFNAVKDKLGTAYGAQNLDEFVAEAFTNKVFQQKLAMLLQPNEKISVWGKFVNTISNFVRNLLGLPSKQQDIKTMDELHTAILSIMAPAPKSRFAGELYMAQAAVDVNFEDTPSVNSPSVRSFFGVVLDKGERVAKELVMHFTPLIPLEQIAKKYIPMATQISKTILEQDGYAKRIHAILSDTAAAITKWAGNNQTKYKEFSDLVNTSTREEVDARLTEAEAKIAYKSDVDKQKLWVTLRNRYRKLPDDVGRKLYGDTFNAYKEIRNEHFSVLKNKIQETAGVDANQADILAKNLEAKLMALGYIDPYAKLGRPDGKYFLTFNAVDPATGKKELYFEIFTSEFVREKRLAELVADKKNVDQASIARTTRGDNTNYRNRAPDTSFIKSVLKVLEDNKVNKEVEDDILALFLDSMPEKSYLKGLTQTRTGTLGYVDVVSTLKQQAFASATHLSRLKYNTEFRRLKAELLKYAATARYSPDADTIGLYAGKLKEHIDFALNPSVEDWAKIASSIGFNFGLGFNVSGFFINLSAFGTLIHPYLAGKYAVGGTNYKKAWGDATKAMGVGFSVFRNSGSFAAPDVNKYRVGLEHYDFSRADIPPGIKMFSALQNRMKELGQFSRVEVEDELNLGAYGNALGGNLAKLNRASGWFMSQSERILRQTTTIATYQLELAKQLKIPVSGLAAAFAAGKITPEMQLAAADEAVLVTELVNSGAMAQTAAEFSKTGFGKVASLFRRYSLNTFSILLKLSRDSIYGTAEDKKIARQQLAGIFGNTAIIAGVGGVPFFGSLALLFDLDRDDDEDDLETATRKMVGEKVYGGLASYLLGSSISSRIGFSDFIFRETYVDKDSPYMWRLALQLGGPLVGMASQFETSAKLIGRGEIRRGMEAAAPSFARNLLKAQRFYAEGPQTVAGDQVAPPIDVREAIMQGLGFPPSDYIQLLEQNAASSKMDRYASELRSDIYTRYYRARKENDVEALARIQEEVEEYRAKFPGYPIRQQDLQASYKRRGRISKEKIAGLTVNRNLESQIQEERDEWDEASSIWDDLFEAEEDTEE